MAQPHISLSPFSGLERENWREFEALLRSIIAVTAVPNDQQANFLRLHLKDGALRFFLTLAEATQNNLENALTALRNQYCDPNLREIHAIKLENFKFIPGKTTPEELLVQIQTCGHQAYPDPILPVVAPAANDADRPRFDRETAVNAERLASAGRNRESQIKRAFIRAMPNWLRLKLFELPQNATPQEACNAARKNLVLKDLCPTDEWSPGSVSEIQQGVTENLVNALTKMGQAQDSLETKISELTRKFDNSQTRQEGSSQKNITQNTQGGGKIFKPRNWNNSGQRSFRPNNNQLGYQNYQQNTNRQKLPRNRNLQWQFAFQTSPQQFYQNQFPAPNQYNQQTSQSQFSEQNPQVSQTFQTTDQSFHYPYVQSAPKICFKC